MSKQKPVTRKDLLKLVLKLTTIKEETKQKDIPDKESNQYILFI